MHLITLCYSWEITNLIALACRRVQLGVIIQRYRVELAYNFTPSTPKLILRGRVELLPNYTIFIDIKCN